MSPILCFGLWHWGDICLSAHDQRDLDFALKYQLPVTTVVRPKDEAGFSVTDSAYTGDGVMVNSGA